MAGLKEMVVKTVKVIIVIILFIVAVSIPTSIYLVRFRNKTFYGRVLKGEVVKYPKLVGLLNLNEPGDNKFYYVSSLKDVISVNVISVNSKTPNKDVKNWLTEILLKSINKKAVFFDKEISYKEDLLQNSDLNKIREEIVCDGPADLNLVYVSSYGVKPSSVGLVLHRDTIFIFYNAIDALSEKGYINNLLEKTTIMHEWGHLLGLEHINRENCIMNELLEVYDHPPTGKNIPAVYCWEELEEIKKIEKEILSFWV